MRARKKSERQKHRAGQGGRVSLKTVAHGRWETRRWPGKPGQPRPSIPARAEERVTETYPSGRKRSSEFWLRDELVGRAYWDELDGFLGLAYGLREGRQHGYHVEYIAGTVSFAERFVNGQVHGWTKNYNRTGKLLIECSFTRGTGTDYWCYDDGRLCEEHPSVAGKPSGVERWWVDEHNVYIEDHWLDGKWHGPRRYWRNGKLEPGFPKFFIKGTRVSKRSFLKASRTDDSLPEYRREEDFPERTLPAEFQRLRERVRRKRSGGNRK
jgi:hypothetical protein